MQLGFENLDVWRRAVDFAVKTIALTETIETRGKHFRLLEQVEAASTSIAMNIAEGKGRYSKKIYAFLLRGSGFPLRSVDIV